MGEDFSKQRNAILKICNLDESKPRKLNMDPVHNLYEGRSVAFINYELDSASQKIVLNKGVDIIEKSDANQFKLFRKSASEIKQIKLEWKERLKVHEAEGHNKVKDFENNLQDN